MHDAQVELWAREVVQRVLAGQPVEDSRVECKGEFPSEHAKAARQIGGLANAARSPEVLWLIGVDDRAGKLTRCPLEDLQSWWPQVRKRFDGEPPHLRLDRRLAFDDAVVLALLFDARQVPFVVPIDGVDRLEVPWRQGTATRSARHGDLIEILVPRMSAPTFEVLDASFEIEAWRRTTVTDVSLSIDLYQTSVLGGTATLPSHRCDAIVSSEALGAVQIPSCRFVAGTRWVGGQSVLPGGGTAEPMSRRETVHQGNQQVQIDGPGRVEVGGTESVEMSFRLMMPAPSVTARVDYVVIETGDHGSIEIPLFRIDDDVRSQTTTARWVLIP